MTVASIDDLLAAQAIGAEVEVSGVEYELVQQVKYGGDQYRNEKRELVRFLAFVADGIVIQHVDGLIDRVPYGWTEKRTSTESRRTGVRLVPENPNA